MAGLYIHIPFCKQKCHYCDFHFSVSLRQKDAMLAALKKELILRKEEIKTPLETIYFGGGTPSLFNDNELNSLFETIYTSYNISDKPEITLEANPDDLSIDYLKKLRNVPINRLSIGVQSFFDDDLKFMNRAHSSEESLKAIKDSQHLGYENITIDLIYGVPGLTLAKWQKNIEIFFTLNLPHLSSYALTVESKTALDYFIKTKKYPPLDDTLARQHFDALVSLMKANNYTHYELSNFGKDKLYSKHNTAYWQGQTYLGIGPSAHSFMQDSRSWNISNNAKYIKSLEANKLPLTIEKLTTTDRYNEYIMTGLRTIWGVDFNTIKTDFGKKYIDYLQARITPHLDLNNLKVIRKNSHETLVVQPAAFFLIDGIIADLFWVD